MKRGFALGMVVLFMVLVAVVISLMSCGGGGGSSGEGSTGSSSTGGTGTVAMLLSDGPADDYEHIWLTITEVSLIPVSQSAAPVVIFQSGTGHRVDLLEYRDEDYLLTVKNGVPAGSYAKIRLKVKDIEVEPTQGSTAPCSSLEIKLPSGKIDLNPRESFSVSAGGTLSIRLDIDANKSINLHQAGMSGKCIFRPVVFVDIKEGVSMARCPKVLSGTIESLKYDTGGKVVGFMLDLQDSRGNIEVRVQENTPVFSNDGECVTPQALKVGDRVKVRGKLATGGVFDASLVGIGQLLDLVGTVIGDPVFNGSLYTFTFEPSINQGLSGQYTVQGQSCTLTLFGCDTVASPQDMKAGMTVRVFGKGVNDNQSFVIRAAAIILRDWEITGKITSVTSVTGGKQVTILQSNEVAVTVFTPNDTPIYLGGDGTVPVDLLCVGRQVRVFLKAGSSASLEASLVKVQSEQKEGTVTSIDAYTRILTVDLGEGKSETVHVEPEATILKSVGDSQSLMSFEDIKAGTNGDYITYFGLPDCSGSPFHAYVLVIGD